MKKAEVQIGGTYLAKVANNLVPVKITAEHPNGGWEGTSTRTGKAIRIKSAQRLRCRYDNAPDAAPAAKDDAASNEAAPARGRNRGQRRATGARTAASDGKPMSLLDAAASILAAEGQARSCKQLVEQAAERGLWTPRSGKTPANTLYAAITREIKVKGEASRFAKADRGKFAPAGNS